MSRRKKKHHTVTIQDVELNIMPFIDIFSLLNTFLLFTATFVSLGVLRVQVPFLSNATPDSKKPARSLEVNVTVSRDNIVLSSEYSQPPKEKNTSTFYSSNEGVAAFHRALLALKHENPKDDLVTLYSDDDVSYEKLVEIIDAIKIDSTIENDGTMDNDTLFPKVVIGSVML